MIQTTKISVIVPVFNTEKYITQCIESVLGQTYQNIELILINDGSTDRSLEKCLARKDDSRVRILSIENHGVSFARNLGLKNATGEWVMFLDSDDYFAGNCLEELMKLVSPDTQMVMAAYTEDASHQAHPLHDSVTADSVRRMTLDPINEDLLPSFYEGKPLSFATCCTKLYRNDILLDHQIRFQENLRLSEDTLFNLVYLSCIQNVVLTNLPVICYRNNTASVTKVFQADHLHDRIRFFKILKGREGTRSAVHILSLLLFEICKVERYAEISKRKQLEQEIRHYLSKNQDLLHYTKKRSLSRGKWQRIAFKGAVLCFLIRQYSAGFALLRGYSHISRGDINDITK